MLALVIQMIGAALENVAMSSNDSTLILFFGHSGRCARVNTMVHLLRDACCRNQYSLCGNV